MGQLIYLNPRPETVERIARKMSGITISLALKRKLVTTKEAVIYCRHYLPRIDRERRNEIELTKRGSYYSYGPMKLRDHRMMSHRGVKNWPPVWTRLGTMSSKSSEGKLVFFSILFSIPKCPVGAFVVIEHEGKTYVGTLLFQDRAFCKQVSDLLHRHVKRTIKEIGNLDLSDTL